MDGTKCITVTVRASIVPSISSGSFSAPGASSVSPAPASCHQNSSHTDTSKETGVFWSSTSPSPTG